MHQGPVFPSANLAFLTENCPEVQDVVILLTFL